MSRWIAPLIAIFTVTGLQAQQLNSTPKLVVSIVVDQLREDYLQYFGNTFGEKGFKRLMNEGLVYHSVEFGFPNVDEASSVASIYTGTYPYYHGIIGNYKFDTANNREISIVADDNYLGNYTNDKLSPLALQAGTIGDELKIASQGKSKIYSIAPNASQAILSGGRHANGVFWLDNYNGKWATTTYYKDIPSYVDRFNSTEAIGNLSEKTWTQSHSHYIGFPYTKRTAPFSYSFGKADKDRFLKIKQTSLINSEITSLAVRFIESAGLGTQPEPDLLALNFYAGNYKASEESEEYSYEIQDIYYRLDKDLEKILDAIERKIGLKHTLIVLSSSGYYDSLNKYPENYKVQGEFYPNRCTALLNMYLMAKYGQGNWVNAYYNNQIYLNKKLAEEKQIQWSVFTQDVAEFVSQFSGVQDVTTAGEWMINDTGRSAYFRRGMYSKLSGDIFIELQPGWIVINENNKDRKEYQRYSSIPSPVFFFGSNITKNDVYRTIQVTEIAPTVSYILRIRPPNGSKALPLQEIMSSEK
ncbi:MAG: alkaline phosphatase family protein [Bacteroidales bacterium]|nr:alkaline phosphatase family protein [Bacteroidales bacterium]